MYPPPYSKYLGVLHLSLALSSRIVGKHLPTPNQKTFVLQTTENSVDTVDIIYFYLVLCDLDMYVECWMIEYI